MWSTGSWARGLEGSVVAAPGTRAQAQWFRPTSLVAPWRVESSQIRDQIRVSCMDRRRILYHLDLETKQHHHQGSPAVFKDICNAAIYRSVFWFGPSIKQTGSPTRSGASVPSSQGPPPLQAGPATPSPEDSLHQTLLLLPAPSEAIGIDRQSPLLGKANL